MNKVILILAGFLLALSSCSETKIPAQDENSSQDFEEKLKNSTNNWKKSTSDIIPEGFKLINSFKIDIDNDSANEALIHCLSDKRVDCELMTDSSCFMDVLLLVKTEPKWHILKQFNVPKPPSTANNEINLLVDSNKSLVLKFNYAPVNPSNVTTTQFYSFSNNEFIVDSIFHSVATKMGPDLMSWNYNFNMVQKQLRFQSLETLSVFDDNDEGAIVRKVDTTLSLNIDTAILISQPISIESLIPEGIEEPYF